MTFTFACRQCKHRNRAELAQAGGSMTCGGCGARITIPTPGASKPAAAVSSGSSEAVAPASVRFACPACGRKFAAKPEMAGQKVRCGGCGQGVRVPVTAGAAPADRPPSSSPSVTTRAAAPRPGVAQSRASAPANAKADPESSPLALDDLYDLEPDAPAPSRAPAAAGFEDDDDEPAPRRRKGGGEAVESVLPSRSEAMAGLKSAAVAEPPKKKKKKRKKSSGGADMQDAVTLLGGALGAVVVVGGLCWAVPGLRFPVGGLLCVVGFVAYLVGAYGFSRAAYEEGAVHGLMCRFVPFYKLYFLLTRWDDMKGHFAMFMAGILLLGPGMILVLSTNEGRKHAFNLAAKGLDAGEDGPDRVFTPADSDREIAAELAKADSTAEARAWLAADPKTHVFWKGDRAAVAKLVDDLYAAGAPKVSCVDITKEPNAEMTAQLVVTLPTEPDARKKVFAAHNAFWKGYVRDADPEELDGLRAKDEGQKYLTLDFDL